MNIKPPLIIASGPAGRGEYLPFLNPRYIGAYTLKTITYKPKKGNPSPRMREGEFYVINRIGLENPGIEGFLREFEEGVYEKLLEKMKVILSLGGDDLDEYVRITEKVKGISDNFLAIEYNFSCPNVKNGGLSVISDVEAWEKVLEKIRRILPNAFLIAKLGIEGLFVEVASEKVAKAGWNGVTLINSVRGYHFDRDGVEIAGGLSGPLMKPIALRAVYEVKRRLKDIYVIGCGGVFSYEDAMVFFQVGADAVCIGSALFKDPEIANAVGKKLLERG